MNEIVDKFIMKAYFTVLRNSQFPPVPSVLYMFKDIVDRDAADIIYPDIDFKTVNAEVIFDVLTRYRCAHSNFGNIYFDARNVLFSINPCDINKLLLPEKTSIKQ